MAEIKQATFEQEIKEFMVGILGNQPHFASIRRLLFMSVVSIAVLLTAMFIIYISLRPGAEFLPYLLYTAVSSIALAAAIAHQSAHKNSFTCMEGMMVGMTIGMMGGFLFGAIIGATNGMFVGTVFGMALGMISGAWAGKCCGIMGLMEGMMGGLMAGTMGAMLSVMMALDNLALFMPILVISCLVIIGSFSFMIYSSAGKREECKVMGIAPFLLLSFLLAAATVAVMLFAPRAASVIF